MAIKPEEALEVAGIDPSKYDSVDDFRTAFEGDWVKRENAKNDPDVRKSVLGKVNDAGRQKLRKYAEEYGMEVDGADFKNGDLLDLVNKFGGALKGKFGEIEELRTKAEKAVPDDVVAEWKKKNDAITKERDAFKGQAVEWQEKFTALEAQVKASNAKRAEETEWGNALSGVQFHQGVNDLARKGFVATAKEKYRLQFGDDGKASLTDASGNPIKHPKKAGELLSLGEALKIDAKEMKLIAANPHEGKPVHQAPTRVLKFGQQPEGDRPKAREVRIAPRMM